jgi:hypothetical protein
MAVKKVKTAEKINTGGGEDRIKTPGWHHVHVMFCDDVTKDNKPVEGLFTEFAAFGGQDAGKVFTMTFFDPNEADADMPEDSKERKRHDFAKRKQTAFLVATGLVNESQMGSDVEFDSNDAVNRQCVIHLEADNQEKNAGKGYLQLAWDDIYHVDDPRVADLVKAKKLTLDAGAINLLPANLRRKPESFDLEKLGGKKSGSTNGNGNGHSGNGSASSKQPVASAAATSGVDLNDI